MTTTEATETMRACLPPSLRDQPIARMAAGLSGAAVYKVGDAHVLKVSAEGDFAQKVAILRAAAAAGVAPEVVHVDAERRAVVSAFVQDRGFRALFMTERARTLALLADALRRIQAIDVPAPHVDPRAFLARVLAATAEAMPADVRGVAEAVLALEPPPANLALAHADANPSNLVWDGERIVFLDWDVASRQSTTYDAAALVVFLRLADPGPLCEATPRFHYDRKVIAALCGTMFLQLARAQGHDGSGGAATGMPDITTAAGKWQMGLALLARAT